MAEKKTNPELIEQENTNKTLLLVENLNPEFNEDQTDNFDLMPEKKKPALSSMKTNLRKLNKRLAKTVPVSETFMQQCDKLKIWIDLGVNDNAINFFFDLNASNMIEDENPTKPDTNADENKRLKELIEDFEENDKQQEELQSQYQEEDWEAFAEYGYYTKNTESEDNAKNELEFEEESETVDISEEEKTDIKTSANKKHKYPNCKIRYSSRKEGLINTYICNDKLIIYLTGSFMRNPDSLGYLTRDNIQEAIEEVCRRAMFRFNVERFISLAGVYLCDICIDIPLKQIERYFYAIACFFPLSSNKHRIMKFGNHGLKLKSKSKNAGSSLTFYNKGARIHAIVNRWASRTGKNANEKLLTYPANIDEILRIEVQMYSLHDIRLLLDIQSDTPKLVRLTDVLNSHATPILKRFEAFEATEEKLREKIAYYVETAEKNPTPSRTARELTKILAAERIAELVSKNNNDFSKVKNYMITELELYDTKAINNLVPLIKDKYWNFLLYWKPKATNKVLDLLNQVHTYYGRRVG